MDSETITYYDLMAERLTDTYNAADVKSLHYLLERWLPREGRVLEIGCGSGRDARFMASTLGLNVTAIDGSREMLSYARHVQSNMEPYGTVSFRQASFPLPSNHELLNEQFDAIIAVAVLMHIPDHELFEFAYQLRTMIKTTGVFVCSFCSERDRDPDDPRLYVNRTAAEVQLLFERIGFNLLRKEESRDGMGRSTTWTTLIFEYDSHLGVRPVDQIESIINRDRKTATYKLALLRALCECAQKSFHHVQWHPEDQVSIPLGLVVEKWIFYYWPLLDTDLELPEMQLSRRVKGLAFRPVLSQLIEAFRPGGLNAFFAGYQSGRISDIQAELLGRAATKIAHTIIEGPVQYSGGSLDGFDNVFAFKGRKSIRYSRGPMDMINGFGRIYFPAAIWRELCLVGHWIGEAILLRWAELSRSFAKFTVETSEILARLLIIPESKRATDEAKEIYSREADLVCVWSDKKLSKNRFDVDHAIPFVVWRNNDFWNLLPADPKINHQKRDKIIAREMLQNRRDCLIHYWRVLHHAAPVRFRNEAARTLLGNNFPKEDWETPLFFAFSEAIETVAHQRGAKRWYDD